MREDQLLQRFSANGSEAAFAELVRRHLDFVYSICRRKVGDADLAQDITQSVFLLLAAKAGTFKSGTVLSGWLFQTAHHACQNALRSEARRRFYEQKASEERNRRMPAQQTGSDTWPEEWCQVEPILDDALAQLSAADRDAVLLRYVEEMSPEEMAVALGISAAAAQKRVSRALERLRRSLARAGTAVTITAVGVILTDKMVQAAPQRMADSIVNLVVSASVGPAASLSAAGGVPGANWIHLGRSVSLSKTQGLLAAILLGASAITGIALMAHSEAALRKPPVTPSVKAAGSTAAEKRMTLQGSVVTADGRPMANASVTVLRRAVSEGMISLFGNAKTDGKGRYTVSGPYADQDQWAVVADTGTQMGFGVPGAPCRLLPATHLRLHLVDAGGQPRPNIRIQPLLLTGIDSAGQQEAINLSLGCPARLSVQSDHNGDASFAGLPQGFIASFTVLDQGYQRRPPAADGLPLIRAADSGTYAVPIAPGASVTGRLLYAETRQPASGVRIGAQGAKTLAWGEAQTDAQGFYQIRQLPPGHYTIAVDEDSPVLGTAWTAVAVQNVALGTGQTKAGQDLRLVPGTLITGRVTQQGSRRPVAGTEIGAYGPAHPATGAWVGGGWTQADGSYHIRVPPGPQHVYPMAAAGSPGVDVVAHAGQKTVVNFSFPAP